MLDAMHASSLVSSIAVAAVFLAAPVARTQAAEQRQVAAHALSAAGTQGANSRQKAQPSAQARPIAQAQPNAQAQPTAQARPIVRVQPIQQAQPARREVRVARLGKLEAWLAVNGGLSVRPWPAAPGRRLELGDASHPRFDARGWLYFDRTHGDGHVVRRTATWVVEKRSTRPRLLRADERAPAYQLAPQVPEPNAATKICVDAGHGGTDPGARGNGLKEAAVNLAIALRLKAWIDADTNDTRGGGTWNLLMTRTQDTTLSLGARTNLANNFGAAAFVSVHNNAHSSSSANGSETFCWTGQSSRPGGRLRNELHDELIAAWRLRNRGVKEANFYVLRNTRMPASLIEGGFVTSPIDSLKMKSSSDIDRLALHLLYGIQEYFGLKRYKPGGGGGNQPGRLRGVVYDASRGVAFRIPGATVSLRSGEFRAASLVAAFTFDLAPGTYSYAATAPGFVPATLTRTVTSNQDVWGSVGLRPANVPALDVPPAPVAGVAFDVTLRGDAGSPAILVFSSRPRLPTIALGPFGHAWVDFGPSITLPAGVLNSSGVLKLRLRSTLKGLRVHLQHLALSRRAWRLGNGRAFQIR